MVFLLVAIHTLNFDLHNCIHPYHQGKIFFGLGKKVLQQGGIKLMGQPDKNIFDAHAVPCEAERSLKSYVTVSLRENKYRPKRYFVTED
jgi:hypothetical protein